MGEDRARCCCVNVFLRCSYSCACCNTTLFRVYSCFSQLHAFLTPSIATLSSVRGLRMGGKINDQRVTSRPCASFPQLYFHGGPERQMLLLDPDPVHAKQYGCCYSEASDGLLSVISHFRNTSTADSGLLLLQSGSGTAGRSASVPSCHAHACRPDPASSMHESFCMGLIDTVFSH